MRNKFILSLFMFFLLLLFYFAAPTTAAEIALLPTSPQPTKVTVVQLEELSTNIDLFEEYSDIKTIYNVFNTSNRKTTLTLKLPVSSVLKSQNNDTAPKLTISEKQFKFYQKQNYYFWEIPLEPNEKLILDFSYKSGYIIKDKKILTAGLRCPLQNLWSGETGKSTINFHFNEINPGQITDIQPISFKIIDNTLSWSWDSLPDCNTIKITADIVSENNRWEAAMSEKERELLHQFLSVHNYQAAAFLYTNKYEAAQADERPFLRVGQAYYLEKAGKHDEALVIWKKLYDDKSLSSYVYWQIAKEYKLHGSNLNNLYKQVRELQVHPLLQDWLANQLPSNLIKHSPPEVILTKAIVDKDKNGLLIKGSFSDPDGDIDKITLRFRCEDNPYVENTFDLKPFEYTQNISFFIPMDKSMQKIYYDFVISDSTQNTINSEQKEVFFLTNEIQSTTYPLHGAKLVLGDYSIDEHDKIYKWFKSYLKMANETKFIPLEGKDPYFIFLGKPNDFITSYQGPLFLKYTPAPFSPNTTKLYVHKYFLSYWYGAGWQQLGDEELLKFGNALLLGQGSFVRIIKYLKHVDQTHFYELLEFIGSGNTWEQGIKDIYQMSASEINVKAYWYTYGNNVLAVVIILLFAWLGKNGYISKLIKSLR